MGELYLDNIEKFLTNEAVKNTAGTADPSPRIPVKRRNPVSIFESSPQSAEFPPYR